MEDIGFFGFFEELEFHIQNLDQVCLLDIDRRINT
jgi:hypothetical protein